MGTTNLDSLVLSKDLHVTGTLTAEGFTPTEGDFDVTGALTVGTTAEIGTDLTVGDDLIVTDDALVSGDLTVTGAAVMGSLTLGTNLAAAEIAALAEETITFFLAAGQSTGTLKDAKLVGVACTIVDVRAKLTVAPVGSTFIIDVNKNGTTIFSTQGNRPTFADGALTSSTTAPDVTAVAAGDHISLDVDQIGSGTAGSNLMVAVTVKRALV